MVLKDEVIEEPRNFNGETFTGRTTLKYNHRGGDEPALYENCTFENGSLLPGGYALFVPHDQKPVAIFKNCDFRNSARGAVAQFCCFIGCTFEHADDGIVAQSEMYLHIEDCTFRDIGVTPGAHADGIQTLGGKYMLVRNCTFDMPDKPEERQYVNSWVFVESAARPVSDVRVVGCSGTGGNYHVYLWDDKYGPPRRCWIDYNVWHGHKTNLPVGYNYAGGKEQIGPHNAYAPTWPPPTSPTD
jgi:hypothetical protein